MKIADIRQVKISSVKRVKYRTRKQPSQATTPNIMSMTQNPIQHLHGRNSKSGYDEQNWNQENDWQYYNNEPHTIRSMCNWTLCPVSPMEIKGKLLLWTSSQLCAVQYGETGRWSLVGKLIKLPVLPTPFKLFCLEWVGRAKVHIFRINGWHL